MVLLMCVHPPLCVHVTHELAMYKFIRSCACDHIFQGQYFCMPVQPTASLDLFQLKWDLGYATATIAFSV